jgi:hypothetical protein
MTDFESEEPPTRPRSVIQAVPLQEGPSEDVADEDVLDGPFQAVRSQAVPPQSVPSQAALFRERRGPADDDADADMVTSADDDMVTPADDVVVLTPADDDVIPTPTDADVIATPTASRGVPRPAADTVTPLLANTDELRAEWQMIRAGFIDNPRGSVAEAANVVEKAAEMLVAALRAQQDRIHDSWDGDGTGIDTEAMRQALLTYQSFFNRIANQ